MPTIQFTYDDSNVHGVDFERTVTVRYAVVPAQHSTTGKPAPSILSAVDECELLASRNAGLLGDCDHLDLMPDDVFDRLMAECEADMMAVK